MSGLLLDTTLTPEQTTYAKAVKTSGEALLALIEELLDYLQDRGRQARSRASARSRCSALIEEITELLAPRAQAKKLEIAAYVDERLPLEVIGDAARLRQVLLNLAGNAIKFTATGGVALIVEPGIWPNEIVFLVRDTGIGIAPERASAHLPRVRAGRRRHRPHLWRHRAGPCASRERIVKRMGGRITLESEPGAGLDLRGRDPAAAVAGRRRAQTAFAAPDLAGKSILLVSPHGIEASLIARRLERWGGQICLRLRCERVARRCCRSAAWHAVLVDHALGAAIADRLGEVARARMRRSGSCCSTPSSRHEQTSGFGLHRLSGQAACARPRSRPVSR